MKSLIDHGQHSGKFDSECALKILGHEERVQIGQEALTKLTFLA